MLVRVVTLGVVLAMVGCGDDSAPGNGDAGKDATMGTDGMGADAPSAGACNPVTQDCPSGQRCTLNHNLPTNTTFCEQGSGPQSEFMSCDPNQSSDNCILGTVCLGVNQTTRVCRRFCDNDTNCGTNVCAINIGNTNGPLHACAQRCQVLMQNCTITGESCYLGLNASNQPTQQCNRTGMNTEGQACMFANDCAPSLLCLSVTNSDAGAGLHCHKACNPGTTTMCTASAECTNMGRCCPFSSPNNALGYCE